MFQPPPVKQEVEVVTCDYCKTTTYKKLVSDFGRVLDMDGWGVIRIKSINATNFGVIEKDICPACVVVILGQ